MMIRKWLNVVPAQEQSISLIESTTFETEVLRAQLWYRGDADELFQFFRQLQKQGAKAGFWESVPANEKVRKIHSGVPAIIANTLAYIVSADLDDITASGRENDWEAITENLDMQALVKKACIETLVTGDGAFKISVDRSLSKYPIVEFVGADRVSYEISRGFVRAVIFRTEYSVNSRQFELQERYMRGRIESRLFDRSGNELPLSTVPALAELKNVIEFPGDYMMAVPVRFFENTRHKGRGRSIFDGGRSDCFDALDEVISQWWDAIRQGRVTKYIPEDMIPRDPSTGALSKVSSFGTEFVKIASQISETGERQKIEVVQPDIKYEAFVNAYNNALLMCLQGLVSPATLGIDVGKMSSAEAQREKKDVTGNTRNTMTAELERVLPELVDAVLMTYDNMQELEPKRCREVDASFGEYGAPDFDSRVETVGKAATFGVMSVETQVDELWGSSKDDEWKAAEVSRIRFERGIVGGAPPAVGDE